MLFQVAVTMRPTEQDATAGKPEEVLLPITQLVASSEQAAQKRALLLASEKQPWSEAEDGRVEVIVRPFV